MNISTLNEMVQHVETHQDLAEFISAVQQYLHDEPKDWENPTLDRYLDAMSRWTESMDGFYKWRDEEMPENPSWKTFAMMLIAATMYE
jgi:hypothetical protein